MEEVKILSNWKFDNEEKLKNLLTRIAREDNECTVDQVTEESCVCLTEDENPGSSSKPELEIKSSRAMKEIKMLSEGSLIEVFGVHDEYLCTCVPEFVDDWEGMAVYFANITLPSISTCRLKFTRIKEKGRLWVYSIRVSVSKQEEQSNSLFNFENVNKFISSPSQQISEKADKFRKFFELYATNSSSSQGVTVQSLLSLINRECTSQYSDCKQMVAKCLNGSNLKSFSDNLCLRKEADRNSRNEMSVECQFLKGYIDSKLKEMREDISKQIEAKLGELKNENNAKLDHIIRLLESSRL